MRTGVGTETALAAIEKVVVDAFAGTVADAGTTIAELELVRVTTASPAGAHPVRFNVPVNKSPPMAWLLEAVTISN